MSNKIHTPVQVASFDVSKLAAMAKLLKVDTQGFFDKASKQEKALEYLTMLNEYANTANIPETSIKATFKNVTGLDYDAMVKNTMTKTPVAAAA